MAVAENWPKSQGRFPVTVLSIPSLVSVSFESVEIKLDLLAVVFMTATLAKLTAPMENRTHEDSMVLLVAVRAS